MKNPVIKGILLTIWGYSKIGAYPNMGVATQGRRAQGRRGSEPMVDYEHRLEFDLLKERVEQQIESTREGIEKGYNIVGEQVFILAFVENTETILRGPFRPSDFDFSRGEGVISLHAELLDGDILSGFFVVDDHSLEGGEQALRELVNQWNKSSNVVQ